MFWHCQTHMVNAPVMNRTQRHVFDALLAVGGGRPVMPTGLVERLEDYLTEGLARAAEPWSGQRIFLSKTQLIQARACEGLIVANSDAAPGMMAGPTAVGIVAHRAIQICYTHPHLTVEDAVSAALEASCREDGFGAFWEQAPVGVQSDLQVSMLSKTVDFLDSFPALDKAWTPRFEASFQVPAGPVLIGGRCDLVLGRPKTDDRQTMFLADLKTGSLRDSHFDEAMFYALAATLHTGVAPFRSTVYSLASHEWTDPDVDADRLFDIAGATIDAVGHIVAAKTGLREPQLTAGTHCRFCPARDTCPAYDPAAAVEPVRLAAKPVAADIPVAAERPTRVAAAGRGRQHNVAVDVPVVEKSIFDID